MSKPPNQLISKDLELGSSILIAVYSLITAILVTLIFFVLFNWKALTGFDETAIDNARKIVLDEKALFLFKFAIMWYVCFVSWRASLLCKLGLKTLASLREFLEDSKYLNEKTRIYSYSDPDLNTPDNSVSIAAIRKDIAARRDKLTSKHGVEKIEALKSLDSISQSFQLNHNVQASEESLHRQIYSLERFLSRYFNDLGYAKSVLPLIGFAGTIVGIMLSMGILAGAILTNPDNITEALGKVLDKLAFAFDTTLVALIGSFLSHRSTKRANREISHEMAAIELGINNRFLSRFHVPEISGHMASITSSLVGDSISQFFSRVNFATKQAADAEGKKDDKEPVAPDG